jgi:hypothetical protein
LVCLAALFLLAGPRRGSAYFLHGYSWPFGTQIMMHLQLARAYDSALEDGAGTWNASAADALATWNQYTDAVQFVAAPDTGSVASHDGSNSVFFSSTIYGEAWPAGTLAVTLNYSPIGGGVLTETDVIFNDNLKWNSYRGPGHGSGPTATFDLHRVALHEFGHVVGLDHPDTHGQVVTAIMNSHIGGLDHLADDDIAGARFLYALRVTSNLKAPTVEVGTAFFYQITANNQPTAYEAAGLPAGLQVDRNTGRISGTPTEVGTFLVTLTVRGNRGDVTATLQIQVTPRVITSPQSASLDIGGSFSYWIGADNNPTSFDAIGLPSGLRIDSKTGQITGVAELSGTYSITIVAHGSFGDAVAVLRLVVNAVPVPTPVIASLPVQSYSRVIAADPKRPYLYLPTSSAEVTVIDASTLKIKTVVPVGGFVGDMAISADGNRLWLAYDPSNGAAPKIRSIDLTTFTLLPDLPVAFQPMRIREGLNGRLYASEFSGKVWAVDSATGATQSQVATISGTPALAISPDRKTLFVGAERGFPASILKYDVSGSTPHLLQSADAGNYGYQLNLSNTGKYICFTTDPGSPPNGTKEFSAADLRNSFGTLLMDQPYSIGFSPDDSVVYQTSQSGPYVGVYDAATAQLLRKIELGNGAAANCVAVDSSGSYVFVVGAAIYGSPWVRAYAANSSGPPRPPAPPHTLLNISTRLPAQPGENALIGGFIVKGDAPKKLALRAIGPSLPVPGKLADPVLQLFDSAGGLIGQNDNWNAHRSEVIATGIPPGDERDAVLVTTVQPGSYTAVLSGVNGAAGVALIEAYDLTPGPSSRLANISTRGKVETGDNVMIGGFILGGEETTPVVVRAIGPSLTNFGIGGALADPMLEVHDGNGGLVAVDDDWREYQAGPLTEIGLAPVDDRESAMLLVLPPGPYTAVVRGKSNGTGVGLVEVYNLLGN